MRIRTNHHTYSQHRRAEHIVKKSWKLQSSARSTFDNSPEWCGMFFFCEIYFIFQTAESEGEKWSLSTEHIWRFFHTCVMSISAILFPAIDDFSHTFILPVPENCRLFVGNCINPIFWSSSSSLSSLHKMCQWTICYSSSILIIKFSDNHNEHRNWATVSWERRQKIFHRPNKTSLNSIQEEKSVRTFY